MTPRRSTTAPPPTPAVMSAAPSVDHEDPRRWWTLGALCLSLVIVMVANGSVNVALPSMGEQLGASDSALQWIVDAYALTFAGMLFAGGAIGDRFGRKGALQGGLVLFLVAAGAAVVADSAAEVIAVRAVMGIAAAFVMPSTLSILSNVFSPAERPRAIALWAGISAGGAALGPPASGLLLEHFWWGSVFLVNVPLVLAALVAGWKLVPRSKNPDETRLDIPGSLLSIAAITAVVYAIIEAPHYGWLSAATALAMLIAAAFVAAFIAWERRTAEPMLDLSLFRDRRFSVASAGIAIAFFTMFGAFFLLTQLLQLVHELSPLTAGLMILPMSLTLMIVAPRAPRLVERYGVRTVAPLGLATTALGLALLGLVGTTEPWLIYVGIIPMATGMGLLVSPLTSLIMAAVPSNRAGVGSAMNDTTRELGGALGVALLGSALTTVYASELDDRGALGALDGESATLARSGLSGAIRAANELGSGGAGLAVTARDAFASGLTVATVSAAAVLLVGAVAARRLLPDGIDDPEATTEG